MDCPSLQVNGLDSTKTVSRVSQDTSTNSKVYSPYVAAWMDRAKHRVFEIQPELLVIRVDACMPATSWVISWSGGEGL